ncbi:hypothetical protein NDU88_004910 [Pleurodeles waltl]|uniref:Uncharacterized protein n=1 Tax=Pleurodeles waltl TaxID=8319 RepID=A0AAV7T9G7_PLEWA|nr:hypothetical protein NDU88_004910 [Pleurodeles waltl]
MPASEIRGGWGRRASQLHGDHLAPEMLVNELSQHGDLLSHGPRCFQREKCVTRRHVHNDTGKLEHI